jgi:hypothetical protein
VKKKMIKKELQKAIKKEKQKARMKFALINGA